MKKSIENIWKEGFDKNADLKAPPIKDLYNQKSIHIIDKFKRMFRINLIAIVAFALVFLGVSYLIYIPVMGGLFFMILMVIVATNKILLNQLEKINKGQNSYEYLKEFNRWVKRQIRINERLARFIYPIFFLSFVLGFWFSRESGNAYLGERIVGEILKGFPETYLVFGVPLIGIVLAVLISVSLVFVGGRIYRWDLNLIYGKIFKKLETLMDDFEKLNDSSEESEML